MKEQPNYIVIGIFALALILFFFLPDSDSKQINVNYDIIKTNIENIKNLPGAEPLEADSMDSMKKKNLVHIGRDFESDASYEEIKSYYSNELISEGWDFVSEESEKDWGKDYGVKDLNFKKDEMKLALTYVPPDQKENYGYNFSISITLEF